MSLNKIALFILLCVVFLCFGYLLGVKVPFTNELPLVIDQKKLEVSKFEYFSLLINLVLAVFTFLTIAVALLKEEIVGLWKKVIFSADLDNEKGFVENISRRSGSTSADSYQLKLKITNNGTINALNCRVIISKVIYKNGASNNAREMKYHANKILTNSEHQILSPSTSFEITIAEININRDNSDNVSNTGPVTPAPAPTPTPTLLIAGGQIEQDCHNGSLEVHFPIHCDSTESLKKVMIIQWDGAWKDRLADIQLNATFKS
ncbi:hypothetical protein [Aeromonas hydrophila]|uniref:hypothetical protein n=1 Tax=Aeromonas hydrophila TaxID=644 RepID=UPI0012D49DFF|nr:hypothetical protein [Aeromonas hydrophila]